MEYDAWSRDASVEENDDTGLTLLGIRPSPTQDALELPVARAALERRMFGQGEPVRIGRFELGARLGGGAMGVVFRAYDPNLARDIAIKLLHPEVGEGDVERARLLREAQALARLSHPNVVHVYDAGTHEGAVFVAMELVAGRDADVESVADWAPSPTSVLAVRGDRRLLLEALRRIPIDYQIALELYHWEGMSAREVGEVLGLEEPGVRSRIRRATAALRTELEKLTTSPTQLESTIAGLSDWARDLRARLAQDVRG